MNSQVLIKKKEEYDMFREADIYRSEKLSVIPLIVEQPQDKNIPLDKLGKVPAVAWKKYQNERASELQLSHWFNFERHNIGIVTGEISGIVVLDIDSEEAYSLASSKGLPDTPTVKTGRGYHLYFKYKEGARNFQKRADLPGIDLRGEGGYVVAPPSLHVSTGTRYEWVKGKGLEDLELAELPDWVLAKTPEEKKSLLQLAKGVYDGERNQALTSLLGIWVKTMSHDEVVRTALEWNKSCAPPDDEGQVLRTVKSIWEAEHAGLPEDIGPSDWEEPVLFDNVELPKLSANLLPSYLGEFAGAVSRAIQAPEGMASLLGLSVAATALQKKVVVSPDAMSDYVEPVNVWAVVVADPSERKSPVLKEMRTPIDVWVSEECVRLREEKGKIDTDRAIIEARIKKLHTSAGNAEDLEGRNKIAEEINTLRAGMPEEVRFPVLWTANVTTERLEQLMVENDEKMAVMNDEGGIFEIMSGLYSNNKVNIDIFLQGYSGNPTRADRASRSAHMHNPLLTVALAIQPKVLEDLAHGNKKSFRGTGLLARFLYYQCETFRGQRLYGNQQQVNAEIRNRYTAGIRSLLDIPLEKDEFGNAILKKLYLDDSARTLWIAFHDEIERRLVRGGELDSVADWAGKLAGTTLRIAGLFHAIEHGVTNRAISSETVERAIKIMRVLIPHAKSALNAISVSSLAKDAEHVCEWIMRNEKREFSKRDCQRELHGRFPTVKEIEPVLSELVGRNIIRLQANPKSFGRPSCKYESNPALFV